MDELLKGIEQAIKDEQQAQKHYQELANKAKDPKVKGMFEQMKKDEEEHERILRSRYESLSRLNKKNR